MERLLNLIFRRGTSTNNTRDELIVMEPESKVATGPELLLLVPDASALSACQLHAFPDAVAAAKWVQHSVRFTLNHGIVAFWALHGKPIAGSGVEGEVMILMRDGTKPDLVYPLSLSGMEHARSWLAKAATDGLDLQSVLLYWALPAKIQHDNGGGVYVVPMEPPSPQNQGIRRRTTIVRKEGTHSADAAESETPAARDDAHKERESTQVSVGVVEAEREAELKPNVDKGTPSASAEPEAQGRDQDVADRLIADAMREKKPAKPRFEQQQGRFRGFGSPKGKF